VRESVSAQCTGEGTRRGLLIFVSALPGRTWRAS